MVELGALALERRRATEASELWERGLALEEEVGAAGPSLYSRLRLGGLFKGCGRLAEAEEVLAPVLRTEAHGMTVVVGLAWSQRGDLFALRGDDEAALECYGRANAVLDQHPHARSEALGGRMRALLRRGAEGRAATDLALLGLLAEVTGRALDRRRHAVARACFDEAQGRSAEALEAARAAASVDAPTTAYRDVHGTRLEALWREAHALAALGRSPRRPRQRAGRWLERLAAGFGAPEHAALYRRATPIRRAVDDGDLGVRW